MTDAKPILLAMARRTAVSDADELCPGYHYDLEIGAWVQSGVLLVDSEDAGRPRPVTKKDDVETGEDMKGH